MVPYDLPIGSGYYVPKMPLRLLLHKGYDGVNLKEVLLKCGLLWGTWYPNLPCLI